MNSIFYMSFKLLFSDNFMGCFDYERTPTTIVTKNK